MCVCVWEGAVLVSPVFKGLSSNNNTVHLDRPRQTQQNMNAVEGRKMPWVILLRSSKPQIKGWIHQKAFLPQATRLKSDIRSAGQQQAGGAKKQREKQKSPVTKHTNQQKHTYTHTHTHTGINTSIHAYIHTQYNTENTPFLVTKFTHGCMY